MKIDGVDRRKGPDIRIRLLAWLSITGWSCFIIALVVFHYARPQIHYGVMRYWGIPVRAHWLTGLQGWFTGLLVVCALLSLLSVLINSRVMKRRHDRFYYNVVLLLLICVAVLLSLFIG